MTLASLTAQYRPRIARELAGLAAFSGSYSSPWARDVELRYREMALGKAMRGILTLIGHGAASGRISAGAVRLGAAIELLHAGFVVQDDVVDQDRMRRGRPSLLAQYEKLARKTPDPRHVGGSMAFLAGDVALLHASRALAGIAARSPGGGRAADAVLRYCTDTGFGEMEDVALGAGITPPDEKAILGMLVRKTARYSCSMPLAAGALLAGGSRKLADDLAAVGEDLGVIFQIRDDELGLFGTTAQTGKPAGSDIREGKQTLYAFHLAAAATPADRRRLQKVYGSPAATEEDLEHVRALTRRYGVDRKVAGIAARRAKRAGRAIAELRVQAPYRELLAEVLAYVSGRES